MMAVESVSSWFPSPPIPSVLDTLEGSLICFALMVFSAGGEHVVEKYHPECFFINKSCKFDRLSFPQEHGQVFSSSSTDKI